jgi:serine/threonine protein kinase
MFHIKASDLTILNKLGEGSFGAVYLGKWQKRHVAIKRLTGSMMSSQVNGSFQIQINI